MHPSAKGAGSFIDGMVGALTLLSIFALIGFFAIAAVACTALYFFGTWIAPYVVELCDILTIWLVDKL